ncbi:hypothetical protein [Sporichthya polymorpha]|uniref:hypothetical protein n=1 Tax=Sporichthya polymorpha TaxID=35751 RepID=UPI000361C005|nr:hypothetical protein [Sporichthya polymorpha]
MFLLRVVLPDRPGSLGALATALGKADADIVGVDVVEQRGDGRAVDDILVQLPPGKMADALVTACNSVEGAQVDFVRFYPSRGGLQRDLQVVEAMTADPPHAEAVLVQLSPNVFRADWAVLIEARDEGDSEPRLLDRSPAAPEEIGDVTTPWLPLTRPIRLPDPAQWAPSLAQSTTAAVMTSGDRVLILGRRGGPEFLDSELARLGHLVALARTISAAGA